jgi:hypothetical protein
LSSPTGWRPFSTSVGCRPRLFHPRGSAPDLFLPGTQGDALSNPGTTPNANGILTTPQRCRIHHLLYHATQHYMMADELIMRLIDDFLLVPVSIVILAVVRLFGIIIVGTGPSKSPI